MNYKYYINYPSKLPKHGWLQSCFMCRAIISIYILEEIYLCENQKYEFYVFLCRDCQRDILQNEYYIKYKKKYRKAIFKTFPQLFKIV